MEQVAPPVPPELQEQAVRQDLLELQGQAEPLEHQEQADMWFIPRS